MVWIHCWTDWFQELNVLHCFHLTFLHWPLFGSHFGCLSSFSLMMPHLHLSLDMTTKWHMRPSKTQISLGIRPVWSESSLCALWVAKGPRFLHADSEDSDQTRRMPRLIWVFAGRTLILLVLSWGGSFLFDNWQKCINNSTKCSKSNQKLENFLLEFYYCVVNL